MIQIRAGVFETNSSSTHSLNICKKSDYLEWVNNPDIVYVGESWRFGPSQFNDKEFVTQQDIVDRAIAYNQEKSDDRYPETIEGWFSKSDNWYSINEATENEVYTYEDWCQYNENLNTYSYSYVSEHGDEIEVFGAYGYDG